VSQAQQLVEAGEPGANHQRVELGHPTALVTRMNHRVVRHF
jgi:hypothetical protein